MSGILTDAQLKWASDFVGIDLRGNDSKHSAPGSPAPGHASEPPGGNTRKPRRETEDERLTKIEDALRGKTKENIGLLGRALLQKQYDDMIQGLERAKAARIADIDGWKPEQAPMSGNVLLGICKGLSTVAKAAFPEVEFLEIAKTGIELVIKGKEHIDQGVEASKADLEAVKKAAHLELNKLIGGAKEQCSHQEDKFQKMIEAEAEKLTPDQLDQLQGMTEPTKVGNFVRDVLGIKRGEEHTPGIVKQMEMQIKNEFYKWVLADFRRRKSGAGAHDVASEGGHSWESMNLHELYRLKQAGDEHGLQAMLANLNQERDRKDPPIPDGWYEKMLHELSQKMTDDFVDEFDDDTNMNVLELPT